MWLAWCLFLQLVTKNRVMAGLGLTMLFPHYVLSFHMSILARRLGPLGLDAH